MANHSNIQETESVFPNRDTKRKSYNTCLPKETIQQAILLGSSDDSKDDLTNSDDEDIRVLFKSFRVRYNQDRKLWKKKLVQLTDGNTSEKILKEHLDHMQQTVEGRLLELSLQLQQQMVQNRSLIEWMHSQRQNQTLEAKFAEREHNT